MFQVAGFNLLSKSMLIIDDDGNEENEELGQLAKTLTLV